MSLNTHIRKALAVEIETLADIAYVAWERDLLPFLNGAATLRAAERNRLSAAVRDGLDRIIVAEVDGVAVGWCQRSRGRAYIPFLFVTPLLQNQGVGSSLLRRMESMLELEGADGDMAAGGAPGGGSSFGARAVVSGSEEREGGGVGVMGNNSPAGGGGVAHMACWAAMQ